MVSALAVKTLRPIDSGIKASKILSDMFQLFGRASDDSPRMKHPGHTTRQTVVSSIPRVFVTQHPRRTIPAAPISRSLFATSSEVIHQVPHLEFPDGSALCTECSTDTPTCITLEKQSLGGDLLLELLFEGFIFPCALRRLMLSLLEERGNPVMFLTKQTPTG